jgi:hypothetical protein
MIKSVEENGLELSPVNALDELQTGKASANNDDSRFAQVRNAGARGDWFGHLAQKMLH